MVINYNSTTIYRGVNETPENKLSASHLSPMDSRFIHNILLQTAEAVKNVMDFFKPPS